MNLTLIRHGLTEGNLRRLYYGSTDIPLTETGIAALRELKAAGGYPAAERYYTSGMRRAEQTFSLLYGDVPHEAVPDLREMDFGRFEMHTYEELCPDPDYQAWITGDMAHNVCPGGESAAQVAARALRAVAPILAAGRDAVCVTHGGVIAGLLCVWFPARGYYDWLPQPGYGYRITFDGDVPQSWMPVPLAGTTET